MKAYGWTPEYARTGVPGGQGWVWYNWALENEYSVWGDRVSRRTPGYVRQETLKILGPEWQTDKS